MSQKNIQCVFRQRVEGKRHPRTVRFVVDPAEVTSLKEQAIRNTYRLQEFSDTPPPNLFSATFLGRMT